MQFKARKKGPTKNTFSRFGCFHGASSCSGRRWTGAGARLASLYDKPVITLCTSCFNRYISSSRLLKFCWTSKKCISADLGKYFPETMSGLVGRGLARSSRILLSGVPSSLVGAAKITAVKGFEHCQHLNFSSSCSAGARLYTERHEWVTFTCNNYVLLCQNSV